MESCLTPLDGVLVTPLKKIHHTKGDIFHALKCTESSFETFGEAYFTTVHCGDLKGWKKHQRMLMNLIVPVGAVNFYFFNENLGKGSVVNAGSDNYVRITVEPGIWVAFKGDSSGLNLILNVASIPHDPTEAINVELDTFPLPRC